MRLQGVVYGEERDEGGCRSDEEHTVAGRSGRAAHERGNDAGARCRTPDDEAELGDESMPGAAAGYGRGVPRQVARADPNA